MNITPPFDFRSHLGSQEIPPLKPSLVGQLVVGVAADQHGVVFAALPDTEMSGRLVTKYDNVVIGPIENDWGRLAKLMRRLPEILGPRHVSSIALRIEEGGFVGIVPDLFERLKSVFPEAMTTLNGDDVRAWIANEGCEVALPDIPDDEPWVTQLMSAAAETAASLLNGHQSEGMPDCVGSEVRETPCKAARNMAASELSEIDSRAEPITEPERRNSPSATAINFTNPYLYIATVKSDLSGQCQLEEDRTCIFKLDSRNAQSLRELQQQLKELFGSWNLNTIAMRVGADKGPYVLNANAYKVEAALQLLEDLRVKELSVAEVSGFGRANDCILPIPQPHLKTRAQQAGQRHAIRAAGLALSRMEKDD